MKIELFDPPRRFSPGNGAVMTDCARIRLEPGEQVTFVTGEGAEYDVARKPWGFYATPSLNSRLPEHGLQPVLIRNPQGRYYLILVERGRDAAFAAYLQAESSTVVCRFDDPSWLEALAKTAGVARHE